MAKWQTRKMKKKITIDKIKPLTKLVYTKHKNTQTLDYIHSFGRRIFPTFGHSNVCHIIKLATKEIMDCDLRLKNVRSFSLYGYFRVRGFVTPIHQIICVYRSFNHVFATKYALHSQNLVYCVLNIFVDWKLGFGLCSIYIYIWIAFTACSLN